MFKGALNPKIKFLAINVCLCLYQHNIKTNNNKKLKIWYSKHNHMKIPFQTFYEDMTISLYIGTCKRIQIHYGMWVDFLVSTF